MKKRNIVLSTIVVLITMLVLIAVLVPNKYNIIYKLFFKEKMAEYVNNIEYDINIEYHDSMVEGGYASTYHYYLINTIEKKVYEIDDYYVYEFENRDKLEKGHHYDVKVKNITQARIDTLLDYIDSTSNEIEDPMYGGEYWSISYKSEIINVKKFDVSLID